MDEPDRDLRAGHVRDQPRAPLGGHVLEYHQVNGQGPQVRADAHRRVRDPLRARGHMYRPAAAAGPVQVVLDAARP